MDDQGGHRRTVPMFLNAFSCKARGKQLPGARRVRAWRLIDAVSWLVVDWKRSYDFGCGVI